MLAAFGASEGIDLPEFDDGLEVFSAERRAALTDKAKSKERRAGP
jgi:hypothetical protein